MISRFGGKLYVLLVAVFACALGFPARAATPAGPLPFAPGETLTYNVTWSVFPAGQVVATLTQLGSGAQDGYEVDTTARSTGFVSLLFKIDNHYHAIFDPRTLCSRQITKTVNEGSRHKQTKIVFDSTRHLAILNERDMGKPGHPLKHAENAIPACVEDILTSFYYLRRAPLHVGEQLKVPVNDGSKTHEVLVEVQEREKLQTPLGTRQAFRIEPRALGDLYKKKGRMLIWLSDDSERLPLRIKAIMLIGTITGTLQSVTHSPPAASTPQP